MASLIFPLSLFGFLLIVFAKKRYRSKLTLIAQFVVGWLVIELAWFHATLSVIIMLMAIGDLSNWSFNTVLGFALSAYNAFQLWALHEEALDSKEEFDKTLPIGLGENYQEKIRPERAATLDKGISKHQWLKP